MSASASESVTTALTRQLKHGAEQALESLAEGRRELRAPRHPAARRGAPNRAEASYRDGVLRIVLPKAEGAASRRLSIKVT